MNLPHGNGTQIYPNGDKYTGYFVSGQKNGIGKFVKNDYTYHGTFANNKMTGYGTMIFNDGRQYKGNFKNGLYDGEGELINGKVIQKGIFSNGKFLG